MLVMSALLTIAGIMSTIPTIVLQETNALQNNTASPNVIIQPDCGDGDFNSFFMTNNFASNSSVHWDLISQDNNNTILSGYFATNDTGGFAELTVIDDVKAGKYDVHFFDDVNFDGILDEGGAEAYSTISKPCEEND